MTHDRSHLYPIDQLTYIRQSDGAPKPDGALKNASRPKILHYDRLYLDHPDPIVFIPLLVNTSRRHKLYDDVIHLLFLHTHREAYRDQ